ncbi:MAG: hypothetical protein ACI87E_005052 [Mariniblastus sp.]|jgi:hypothetical protein
MNSRLLLVAVVFSVVSIASGQAEAQTLGSLTKTEAAGVYKIDFPGGPLEEYIKLILGLPHDPDAGLEGVNVVVTDNARVGVASTLLGGRRLG